ncbi:MAG TPA: hypothetical protein VGA02_08115 [Gemmatimonadales bacterium]|jgi:hypothetical protein
MQPSYLLAGIVAATAGVAAQSPCCGAAAQLSAASPALSTDREAAPLPADTTRVKLAAKLEDMTGYEAEVVEHAEGRDKSPGTE